MHRTEEEGENAESFWNRELKGRERWANKTDFIFSSPTNILLMVGRVLGSSSI